MEQSARLRGRRAGAIAAATLAVAGAYVAAVLSPNVLASPAAPSAAEQYAPKKVTICHHARGKKGTKHVTIRINRSALRAHQRHGDTLGPCSTARNQRAHKAKAHAKKFHKTAKAKGKKK